MSRHDVADEVYRDVHYPSPTGVSQNRGPDVKLQMKQKRISWNPIVTISSCLTLHREFRSRPQSMIQSNLLEFAAITGYFFAKIVRTLIVLINSINNTKNTATVTLSSNPLTVSRRVIILIVLISLRNNTNSNPLLKPPHRFRKSPIPLN